MAGKPVIKKSTKAVLKTKKEFTDKFEALKELVLRNNLEVIEERNSNHKPLDLLILLVLNQSTTDALSDRAFAQLKKDYPSYHTILKENNPAKLVKSIQICGLAKSKAQYILNVLHFLNERNWLDESLSFINEMSDDEALKTLTQIKGVGVKSASCLLMFSFGRGTFPIDTHLYRILQRVGDTIPPKASTEQAHKILQPRIQGKEAFTVHVALIELGRKVCLSPPRKPLCEECYLKSICELGVNSLLQLS